MPRGRPPSLDRNLLEAALAGLELQKQRVEEHIAAMRSRLGQGPAKPLAQPRRRKRRLSAEGRARIAAAAKKRWAAIRKQTKTARKSK
jgi:hypothetical protein